MVLLAYSLHFWGILWYFSIQKLPEKWGNGFSGSLKAKFGMARQQIGIIRIGNKFAHDFLNFRIVSRVFEDEPIGNQIRLLLHIELIEPLARCTMRFVGIANIVAIATFRAQNRAVQPQFQPQLVLPNVRHFVYEQMLFAGVGLAEIAHIQIARKVHGAKRRHRHPIVLKIGNEFALVNANAVIIQAALVNALG